MRQGLPNLPGLTGLSGKPTLPGLELLGAIDRQRGDNASALKSFEAASAKDPKMEVAKINRGVALLNLQRVDEAKALLEDVVKHYEKELGFVFTAAERADLVAFLEAL